MAKSPVTMEMILPANLKTISISWLPIQSIVDEAADIRKLMWLVLLCSIVCDIGFIF